MKQPPTQDHGYWQSLREFEGDAGFLEGLADEFSADARLPVDGVSRRRFLQVMSASVALAGLAGCEWPEEEILPFDRRPEGYEPGRIARYATTLSVAGRVRPVLASSYDGRPIKLEGNPDHPLSLGATDARTQAEILGLYDPDRSRSPRRRHAGIPLPATWEEAETAVFATLRGSGSRLGVLFREPPSRATARALQGLPECKTYVENPISSAPRAMTHRVDESVVIACLYDDFLVDLDESLRSAQQFASGRDPHHDMNRLYCVESVPTPTGATADHRIVVDADRIPSALEFLAHRLQERGELANPGSLAGVRPSGVRGLSKSTRASLTSLAEDLARHAPAVMVTLGERHSERSHELVARINDALGAAGHTVFYASTPPRSYSGLADLAAALREGQLDALLVVEANPVYTAPHDLDFAELLGRVSLSVHAGLYQDETAEGCDWHLPLAHALESWDLLEDCEGRLCATQPLIEPLFGGLTPAEILARLSSVTPVRSYDLVRQTLAADRSPSVDFESRWHELLRRGFEDSTASAGRPVLATIEGGMPTPLIDGYCVRLSPDPRIHDGRYANNAWLQELPDALTKLTWDNALLIAPATADSLRVSHGDVVLVECDGASVEIPVLLLPGTAPRTLGLCLGYGRRRSGRVGDGVGVDVSALRASARGFVLQNVQVSKTGRRTDLACTQDHWAIDARGAAERQRRIPALVREGTLGQFRHHPEFAQHMGVHHPPLRSLWREREGDGHQWGMAIDLNRCTSCNACIVACQAENNIPVVGKDQVLRGREMHWLRLDRYFAGSADQPTVVSQPMGCAHCELAPCEQVCPVGATMHSTEGLNVMAYNRCVGTRYCANNCPYKVRRFNFFNYRENVPRVRALGFNPEVTIRARGVMEKCTYCVQRIEHARIDAKNQRRELRDGDIVTACQQSCPTEAIRFGDLSDPESDVSRHHDDERAYAVLAELNIKPRTRYLARIRNPRLEAGGEHDSTTGSGGHDS